MSRRERVLLVLAGVVVIALIFYFYVYSPKQAEYRRLTEQLADRENQLQRMEATARQAERLQKEYTDLQSFIASVEAKLPTQKEMAALLVQLERLTKSLDINLMAIRPSALEGANGGPPPAPPAGGQRPPGQPRGAAAAYLRFPIKLTMVASYAEALQLMRALHGFPRLIVVRKITVTPKTVPELTTDLDVETVVLPKEAR